MPHTAQIASTKQKLTETKQAIKDLQEKKSSVTNTEELKALNKQINALQEEVGELKSDVRLYASLNKDALRDWHEMVLGVIRIFIFVQMWVKKYRFGQNSFFNQSFAITFSICSPRPMV